MPPATVLSAVVRLPNVNGITADLVENVLHFGSIANPLDADLELLLDEIRDFYITDQNTTVNSLGQLLSNSISRAANAAQIFLYQSADLSGATPFGAPIKTRNFTIPAAAAASDLPAEVAMVVSYAADLTGVPVTAPNPLPPPAPPTIRPQQRRRGRMYLGPFNTAAIVTTAGQSRPGNTPISVATQQFAAMVGGIGSIVGGFYLGIWSRMDEDVYEYDSGYVDNAWDTQRRRGVEATTRTAIP